MIVVCLKTMVQIHSPAISLGISYCCPALGSSSALLRAQNVLQGPTSTGKTSLVAHLAAQTGHRCVRINNHEQTDLQVRTCAL